MGVVVQVQPRSSSSAIEPAAALLPRLVVLDSNVVLDLWLFEDVGVTALAAQLDDGSARWLATAAMRDELARVLGYPRIVAWLTRRSRDPAQVALHVLARFDALAQIVATAPGAPLLCRDPDDQRFVDLACAHGAELVSKDRAVREVWRRLASVAAVIPGRIY